MNGKERALPMGSRATLLAISAMSVLTADPSLANDQAALLARGEYLVNAVMGCDGCHTPRPGGVFNMTRRFSGGYQVWDEPAYTVRGSNITQDLETGIGSWSVADIKKLLTDGVRPSGVPVAHQMPYPFYKILTTGDLDAVATYIKSLPAVRNQVPPPVYRAVSHTVLIPDAEKSIGDTVPTDPVKRGFYLATIAHCMECHSRKPDGTQDYKTWQGKGGYIFKGPFGQVPVRNISSHKEKGIGAWTDAEIKQALTKGIDRNGRSFHLPMARHVYYSKMTAADIDAIVAWVRTIPPIE
jgi:mono/diheme cytochrome c family protein